MRRILVTGATGFIGSNLIRELCRTTGDRISIVKRAGSNTAVLDDVLSQLKIYTLDGRADNLYEILEEEKPDVVVHLATLYLGNHKPADVEPMFEANIIFGTKLLDAMAAAGVERFVNTGTFSEYSEDIAEYAPASLYAATKRAFEDILHFYIHAKNFKAMTVKLYDTYGPQDPRPKLFSIFKKNLRDQAPLEFSPGGQAIDLLYIDDAVEVFKKAVEYVLTNDPQGETIFAGSGVSTKVKDVASVFEEVAGKKLNIQWGARPYRDKEIMVARADVRAAKEKLGWTPRISLKEGLTRMLKQEKLI